MMIHEPEAVDVRAEKYLREAYLAVDGRDEGAELTFESWTPVSARKTRQRRFMRLYANGEPLLVSKIPLCSDDPKAEAEFSKLRNLGAEVSVDRPRPLRAVERGFVMTNAPAEDLPDALVRRTDREEFRRLLLRTVGTIAELHNSEPADPGARLSPWEAARQYVAEPFAEEPRFREALEEALVGHTHGDLAPWNIRYDETDDRVTIIDWEDYRPAGIASMDVLNLLITLSLVVFPDYRDRGFDWLYRQLFHGDHWYRQLFGEAIREYSRSTDQDPRRVLDLIPFFCQWLIARIEAEGRSTANLYYATFIAKYSAEKIDWMREFEQA